MNDADRELVRVIRGSLPPLGGAPPSVDLWPRLRWRLDDRRPGVGKLDWPLAAIVLGLLGGFPETAMLVLYHL